MGRTASGLVWAAQALLIVVGNGEDLPETAPNSPSREGRDKDAALGGPLPTRKLVGLLPAPTTAQLIRATLLAE